MTVTYTWNKINKMHFTSYINHVFKIMDSFLPEAIYEIDPDLKTQTTDVLVVI